MKTRTGFGVLLLAIGVVWILLNYNIISFNYVYKTFAAFIKLWPLILIVVGVNIIFKYNFAVKLVSWVLYLTILVSYGVIANPKYDFKLSDVKFDLHLNDIKNEEFTKKREELKEATKTGKLDISLGAAKINIGGTTDYLYDMDIPKGIKLKNVDYSNNNSEAKIKIDKNDGFDFGNRAADVRLNKDVLWDININNDAFTGKLDMSELKIKKFDLDIKASSVDMNFGSRYDKTKAEIEAKASNINITVPKSSGVRIKIKGKLNNVNMDKSEWNINNDTYESANYTNAQSQIDIEMDMDMSNIKVRRVE